MAQKRFVWAGGFIYNETKQLFDEGGFGMSHPPMTPPPIQLTTQEAAYAENAKKFMQSFFAMKEHVLKYNLFLPRWSPYRA